VANHTVIAQAHTDLVLLAILGAAAVFLVLAFRTRIPYPILLVLGGAGIGFIPGMPDAGLDPDVVLLIFLPPLLYAAAFFSSLRDLRANLRPISQLAIGLVAVTVCGIALVAHAVIHGLSWEAAFVLGAVLSPTDAVAASAIAGQVGAPRRFVTIIEGESLVNDSTALIAYKFAIGAALTGSFSLLDAAGTLAVNAVAGVAIGYAVGRIVAEARRRIDDAPTEITISLMTPYFAYLPAEAAGVSAVLAAVTAGIVLGWRSPELITPATRIQAFSFWEILVFVLNAALFVLLGLQLPDVIDGAADDFSAATLAGYAGAVSAALIALRFLGVFAATYGPWLVARRSRRRHAPAPWRLTFLVAWSGMRGAVSLAAALAIPFATGAGSGFPARDLIVFLTYAAILATLVLQGLTLPWLIRMLGVEDDGKGEAREVKARMKAAKAAIARIEELLGAEWVREESATRMRGLYEYRIRRFKARFDDGDDGAIEDQSQAYQRLRREVLEAERAAIVAMRNDGFISDEVMHRIERDLDLEDARLEI
jgi:CPA1 family monovalent cation:H+ antiporter